MRQFVILPVDLNTQVGQLIHAIRLIANPNTKTVPHITLSGPWGEELPEDYVSAFYRAQKRLELGVDLLAKTLSIWTTHGLSLVLSCETIYNVRRPFPQALWHKPDIERALGHPGVPHITLYEGTMNDVDYALQLSNVIRPLIPVRVICQAPELMPTQTHLQPHHNTKLLDPAFQNAARCLHVGAGLPPQNLDVIDARIAMVKTLVAVSGLAWNQ